MELCCTFHLVPLVVQNILEKCFNCWTVQAAPHCPGSSSAWRFYFMSARIQTAASDTQGLRCCSCSLWNNVFIQAYCRCNQTFISEKTAEVNENHGWCSAWVSEGRRGLPALGADGVRVISKPVESWPTPANCSQRLVWVDSFAVWRPGPSGLPSTLLLQDGSLLLHQQSQGGADPPAAFVSALRGSQGDLCFTGVPAVLRRHLQGDVATARALIGSSLGRAVGATELEQPSRHV